MSDNTRSFIKNSITISKFALLIIIILGIPVFVYFKYHEIIDNFGAVDKIESFLNNNRNNAAWIYLILQIAQLVICVLPGQAVQFAGGYMFNLGLGIVLTMGGCAVGTVIAFYISRLLGKDAMYLFFNKEQFDSYIDKLNSKRAFMLLFIIYLIPGIPKDMFAYAIGVSNMRFIPFFIISLIGRAPAMICSLVVGNMVATGSYTGALIISLIVLVLTVIGIAKRDKINVFTDIIYERLVLK